MTGWLRQWPNDFERSSASRGVKSMMKRAQRWTLSAVRASGSWASTSPLPPQPTRGVAAALHAQAQKADGVDARAQRSVPPTPVAADRTGDTLDQSGATGVGELLRGGALQRVLQLHQRLGGEEGQAPTGARSEAKGLRLGTME